MEEKLEALTELFGAVFMPLESDPVLNMGLEGSEDPELPARDAGLDDPAVGTE